VSGVSERNAVTLVGRHRQLLDVDAALRAVETRVPQAVVLAGAAGMGKTHLLTHLAAWLADRDALVLATGCAEIGASGVPLVPVTSAIRQLVGTVGLDRLAATAPAVRTLVRFLPECHDGRSRPDAATIADLFAGVLHRLGTERLVAWLVDDLHWADPSTRDLIAYLARTLRDTRVLLVLTHRDDHPDAHPVNLFVSDLGRLPHVTSSPLAPLTRGEIHELLAGMRPAPPSAAEVDSVLARSGGNPFYATELAHAATGLPRNLRTVLLAPIDALDADARAVVGVLALGDVVGHDLIGRATGLADPALTNAVRAAVSARAVDVVADGYRLRHALLAEAVADRMLPVERARLHRACAEALEKEGGSPALLARHWAGAGRPARALPATLAAAGQAGEIRAYAEQAHLLDRALRLWIEIPDAAAVTGAGLPDLYGTATAAAMWAGDYVQVLDLVERGLAEPAVRAQPTLAALLLAHRAMALTHQSRPGAIRAVEKSLATLPAAAAADPVRVLDYLASTLTLRGYPHRGLALAEEAQRLAAEARDTGLTVKAHTTAGWILAELGRYDDALAALDVASKRAGDGDTEDDPAPRLWLNRTNALYGLGRYADAVDAARTALASPRMSGLDRTLGLGLQLMLAPALLATGRHGEALTVIDEALARDPAASMSGQLLARRAEIAMLQGDTVAARHAVHAARAATGTDRGSRPAAIELPLLRIEADLGLAAGDPTAAAAAVDRALRTRWAPPHELWPVLLVGLRVAADPGLARARPEVAERLRTAVDGAAATVGPLDSPASVAYAAQFAAQSAPDGTGDPRAWTRAADSWRGCGHVVNEAVCLARAGQAAIAVDRAGGRDLLAAALATARDIGAAALVDEIRVSSRAAHLDLDGDQHPCGPAARLGLTAREVEVLGMVADGWSNKQIGTALYVSPKTVSVHVSNILDKLGVASRGEAAALALRSGLVR
jgi:DNA-binding CsgD family transcriptional regulator/tetratricopeptide (TPR) repeat protein